MVPVFKENKERSGSPMQTPVMQLSEVGNPGNKKCSGQLLRNSEEANMEREIVIGPVCGSTTLQEWHMSSAHRGVVSLSWMPSEHPSPFPALGEWPKENSTRFGTWKVKWVGTFDNGVKLHFQLEFVTTSQ